MFGKQINIKWLIALLFSGILIFSFIVYHQLSAIENALPNERLKLNSNVAALSIAIDKYNEKFTFFHVSDQIDSNTTMSNTVSALADTLHELIQIANIENANATLFCKDLNFALAAGDSLLAKMSENPQYVYEHFEEIEEVHSKLDLQRLALVKINRRLDEHFQEQQVGLVEGISRLFLAFLFFLTITVSGIVLLYRKAQDEIRTNSQLDKELKLLNLALEKQVLEKTIQLSSVFEQVTDGVLILDNEFNFIYFNANAVDYFQLTTESVKNIAMSDIGALGPNHPLTLDLNKALSNQQSIEAEYHIAALDKWLFAKIYPSESQIVVFLKDIDQEKKAKVDKAQTVERMEAVMKAINDVIWDYDVLANQIVYNDNFIELYKISKEDMAIDNTRIWSSRLHPVERDAVESHFLEVLRSNKLTWQDEYRFRRGDDTYAHVLDRGYIIRNSKGDAIRVIGTMIDITERKKNEVENANLALIIERTSDLVAYSDHEFNPIFINRAGIESLGLRDLEHYKQCHLSAFYTNTTLKTLTTLAVPHAIKHGIWSGETELKRLDGSVFPGSQIIISHKNKDGSLGLLSTIVRDISEIKNFQQNQKELTLQLRQLSNHLQNAVEDERANISREIHDELGQLLTAIKLKNQRQFELVGLPDTSALKGSLQDEIKSIDAAIKTVQRISSELRPSMLDDLGLLEAMEWQIQKVRKSSNLEIEFNHAINELIDDKHFKTSVFRILQESLTNIVRHSQANKVTIEFNEYENYNALTIIDNGVGFNINSVSKFSLGLLGMRERAATIGAELNIFSDYKAGTKIELKIPIFPPQQIIAN